jgi:hypothetical protein
MAIRGLLAMALAGTAAGTAHAIEFWHSNTVWGGQGMCSATFTFDSGLVEIASLNIEVALVDASGTEVLADTLTVAEFGGSGVDRYADAMIDGAEVCHDGLTLQVKSASAALDGKPTDLLAARSLTAREFKPFTIRLP